MRVRVYDVLLRAWPAEFRRRHGSAMRQAYDDALAEARVAGAHRVFVTRLAWWGDALRHGFAERLKGHRTVAGAGPRAARGFAPSGLAFDVRLAVRRIVREPGFALFVALTLALGIGGTTAVFTFYNAVFLRPLPWPDGDRLVRIQMVDGQGRARTRVSIPDATDLAAVPGMAGVAVVDYGSVAIAGGDGDAVVARSAYASPSLFVLLGTQPARGRLFTDAEAQPGNGDVVVLSDGLWRRRFGANPAVLGETLEVQGRQHIVVGVLPTDFVTPDPALGGAPDVWLPLAVDGALAHRGTRWLQGIARLEAGADIVHVTTGMATVAQRLAAEYPETNEGLTMRPLQLRDAMWGDVRGQMRLMLGAAAFVLLIACANLANLLLARNAARANEMAVRTALGSGRMRTVQQLIVEHGALALLGGVAGCGLVFMVRGLARQAAGGSLPALLDAPVDLRVLGFLLVTSLLAGVLFGIAPVLRMRRGAADLLREGRAVTRSRAARMVQRLLVGAQVALCFVLLAGAALMLRGFRDALSVDIGFDAERVLSWEVALPASRYGEHDAVLAYTDAVLERLAALPGVEAAGLVDRLPLGTRYGCNDLAVEGALPPEPGATPCADPRAVTPDYLRAMGIRHLEGRPLSPDEPDGVLVNQTLARSLWPGESPLGRRIAWAGAPADSAHWWHVVGVVDDVLHLGPLEPALPEVYMPFESAPDRRASFVVRAGDPAALAPAVRAATAEVDAAVPLRNLRTLDEALVSRLSTPRTGMLILGLLSVVALFLAVVGLYGVQAYLVARRRTELGIRIALGASSRDVVRLVLFDGMRTVLFATLVGGALAFGVSGALRAFLVGTNPADPLTFAAVAALLVAVSALACWLPAWRASAIGPTEAMRQE